MTSGCYLLVVNFVCVLITQFTYNGLAETVGIFIVLTFLVYIFLCLNRYLKNI